MNNALIEYIEKNVFPLYSRNEEGHGINHIKTVIRRSLELSKDLDVDEDIVYTVAAYHDLGHFVDRKTHEIISAQMFMEDEKVKEFFTEEERVIIKEAIEDHRASSDHEPRSIYGKIVSSADRTISDVETSIRRAYSYGLKNYPDISYEQRLERVYSHLKEKYGEDGYAKNYIIDKEYEESIKKFREALSNKEEFLNRIRKISKEF